jgi:cytochrome P450
VIRRITGDGLIAVEGGEHRRQRKILNPAFAGHQVKHLVGTFWVKACELKGLWESEALGAGKRGYDVSTSLTRTTLDIIGLTGNPILMMLMVGFGCDFGALQDASNPIAQAYLNIFENSPETMFFVLMLGLFPILDKFPLSYIKRSNAAKASIETAAMELITARVAEGRDDATDILGCMMKENQRLESIGEEGLSNEEMLHQIFTFLAAGYVPSTESLMIVMKQHQQH